MYWIQIGVILNQFNASLLNKGIISKYVHVLITLAGGLENPENCITSPEAFMDAEHEINSGKCSELTWVHMSRYYMHLINLLQVSSQPGTAQVTIKLGFFIQCIQQLINLNSENLCTVYMFLCNDGLIGCVIQEQCRVLMGCCPCLVILNLLSDSPSYTPSLAITNPLTESSGPFLIPLQL